MPVCLNPAQRRYNRRVVAYSLFYAGSLLVEKYALRELRPGDTLAYLLAALPALGLIAIFAALGRYLVEEQDEYLRMRTIRQILWATGLTLAATTLWGFIEDAQLLPHVPICYTAILWFAALGAAAIMLRLRDR